LRTGNPLRALDCLSSSSWWNRGLLHYRGNARVMPFVETKGTLSSGQRPWQGRLRICALILLCTLACDLPARADEDDTPVTPGMRSLAITCFVVVCGWILTSCLRAIRARPRQRAAWERPSDYPPWLERLLERMQNSSFGRSGGRRRSSKYKAKRPPGK
jgi:hypothetical protein